jgi:hypothetical protein
MTTETEASATAPRGWGLDCVEGTRYHWSARAIYPVDLLWDRMAVEGDATEGERKALGAWLDNKALPYLRAWFAEGENVPYQSEDREVTVSGDGYTLRASPRASHGYLYLSAAPDPSAQASGPTPTYAPRPINDARGDCRACKAAPRDKHRATCTAAPRIAARQAKTGVRPAPRKRLARDAQRSDRGRSW